MKSINTSATLLVAGLLFVNAPYVLQGQSNSVESPSNIECLEHLEIPDYPVMAFHGRIHGTLTVKVLLSGQATVRKAESSLQGNAAGPDKIFKPGAENAVKNSRFSRVCGGKTVTLVFHFELTNDKDRSVAFEPPNHFFIRSGAVYVP
ncbi:MAG: hypothetical protein ABL995_21155 [Bryobacteraceae bacterium]